jgi:hypothetical protein
MFIGRFGVAGLVVVLVGLLAFAPAASGAPKTIGGFIGGPLGVTGGEFTAPRGVAVNDSGAGAAEPGDVYVAESGNRRIQVLDADGNFKFAFGRDVIALGAAGDLGDVLEVCVVAASCQIGSAGTSADGPGGELPNVQGIVIDQSSGDVFVRDRDNRRVQQFTAAGGFVRAWGWDVVRPGGNGDLGDAFEVCEVAADCQAATTAGGGAQAGQFGASSTSQTGIALGPGGNVLVVDSANRRVMEFDPDAGSPAGVFVRAFGWAVDGGATFEACTTASSCGIGTAGTTNGQLAANNPLHVAVDADNVVYVSDNSSGGTANRVLRFDADLAPASGNATAALLTPIYPTTGTPTGPLLAGVTQGLAVDPSTGNLLVVRDPASGNTVVQELSTPGAVPAVAPDSPHVFAVQATQGLGYDTSKGNIYLSVATTPPPGQGLFVLAEAPGLPSGVAIEQPLAVGAETVTLVGTLDPNIGAVAYRFEVSDTGADTDWEPVGTKRYLTGDGARDVALDATGLQPNTSYRVRLTVTKQTGLSSSTTVLSPEAVFLTDSTAPGAATLGSAERTDTSALLRAWIDPNGSDTTYRFEYGAPGGTLDNHIPVPAGNAGSGNSQQLVVQRAIGLAPDTAYEYRVVATNAAGTTTGERVGFDTRPVPGPDVPVADRGYELVSPADKVAGIGLGQWGAEPLSIGSVGIAAYDGERFAAQGTQGAMLLGDAAQAYANDWAFADRVGDQAGWQSHTPHTHPSLDSAETRFVSPHAATGDFSRIAWRTNNSPQAIFPEMVSWPDGLKPTLISDWDGRWEVFGPTDMAQVTEPRTTPSDEALCEIVFSHDGSATLCGTDLGTAAGGIAMLRGLGGAGDPTHPAWPNLVGGRSIYLADTSGEPADNFAGTGARMLVNVCADGTELPAVDVDGDLTAAACPAPLPGRDATLVSDRGATLQPGDAAVAEDVLGSTENVVSTDGSRVFFMSPDPSAPGVPDGVGVFCDAPGETCPTQLFVRQRNEDGSVTTRWVSRAEDGLFGSQDATLTGTVRFEGASVDGDKVFFRTDSPLTADDPNATGSAPVTTGQASDQSWDLYMYDLPDAAGADPGDGDLTRISGGPGGDSDCNSPVDGGNARGALRFVSDAGGRVYFTCATPLVGAVNLPDSGTITSPAGTAQTTDASNLYLYDTGRDGADRWRFVTRLPRAGAQTIDGCATTGFDRRSTVRGDVFAGKGNNCVRGTADGGFVTFLTLGRLTDDDPSAQATADIYGYDAVRNELTRLTAPQGGLGGSYPCGTSGTAASTLCNGDGGYDTVATDNAGKRETNPPLGIATDPLVAGSQVAFFQSRSRLTADDLDAAMDVYEWHDGKLSLLTGAVQVGVDAFFKGNDRTGRNAYVATTGSLTWQDHDAVADVYTARVGGGIDQPPVPPVCGVLAGSCQAPGRSGSASAADSAADGGGGNAQELRAPTISVAAPGTKALRRAARTGVLALRVRVPNAGAVRAVAKARVRVRGRMVSRRVSARTVRAGRPGVVVVRLRLNRLAKTRLGDRQRLPVTVTVTGAGARAGSVRLTLRRAGR